MGEEHFLYPDLKLRAQVTCYKSVQCEGTHIDL
jgi:hypothetical protein